MLFSELKLSAPILKAIESKGYKSTTPIQEKIIPVILKGKDVMAAAQTGTGKTAGFTLPLLELLSSKGKAADKQQVRALILTPTRELAAQVANSVDAYGKNLELSSLVVFGGVNINPQIRKLKSGVDILIATPGRLLDLHTKQAVDLSKINYFILDEADRMLDMGFINDIRKIINLLPSKKQTLMFSATFSSKIKKLATGLMVNPVEVAIAPKVTTAKAVTQWLCPVDKQQKPALLTHLILENNWNPVLVFTKTKHGANRLVKSLIKENISAIAIHGNKTQAARTKALESFKNHKTQVLVATDIAARGLDINLLPYVVNFDLPQVPEDYVHRIGRTGRASASGEAISLVSADEFNLLVNIEKLINKQITRKYIDYFHPDHDLPKSESVSNPRKANNTRKTKQPKHTNKRQEKSKLKSGTGAQIKINSNSKSKPKLKPKSSFKHKQTKSGHAHKRRSKKS